MATCFYCNQDMTTAASCFIFDESGRAFAASALDMSDVPPGCETNLCPDCHVQPGGAHHGGCDIERCSHCGGQWIACGHDEHDNRLTRWTGEYPGLADARARGLFCRSLHADGSPVTDENPIDWDKELQERTIQFHVPCGPDDPGARPDLNRMEMVRRSKRPT